MLDFYKFICAFNEFKGKITDTFIYMSALRINLLNIWFLVLLNEKSRLIKETHKNFCFSLKRVQDKELFLVPKIFTYHLHIQTNPLQ